MSLNEPIEVPSRMNAAKDEVKTLPLLPLRNTVLFPHLFVPLSVGRSASVAAVESALAAEDKTFLVAAQKSTDNDQPEYADLHTVGTRAVVKKMVARRHPCIETVGARRRASPSLSACRTNRAVSGPYATFCRYPLPDRRAATEVEAMYRADRWEMSRPGAGTGSRHRCRSTVQQLAAQAQDPLRLRVPASAPCWQSRRDQRAGAARSADTVTRR